MSNRIKLRALTSSDIEKTLKWHNKDDIKKLYLGHPFPVNLEQEKQWYDEILTSNIPTTIFGIEIIQSGELIGITVLKKINLINRKSEFAIYIGDDEERGKGYATEATMMTLKFGFNDLGLNRIYLQVIKDNSSAIDLYESCGFKKEGYLRESLFKNCEYKDEIIMSILKNEFENR